MTIKLNEDELKQAVSLWVARTFGDRFTLNNVQMVDLNAYNKPSRPVLAAKVDVSEKIVAQVEITESKPITERTDPNYAAAFGGGED